MLRSVAVIATVLCASSPATAWAHIYKWVDERGMTVYSNVLPEKSPKNVQMVVEEKPADRAPAAEAMRREQQLLERIASLERQVQAQQYQQYPQQYIPQPPPPSIDYAGYYPSYYPLYPYVVLTNRFVGRAHSFISPRFASAHVGSFHHGGMSRGRR